MKNIMEQGPEMRIIGTAPEDKKATVKEAALKALYHHADTLSPEVVEQFAKLEYPKSEKERALIRFANTETDAVMRDVGVEPLEIPEENYHIVPPDVYSGFFKQHGIATTFNKSKMVIFDARHFRDNPLHFAATAFHETLHMKAHFSLEVNEGEDGAIIDTPYREGVSIRPRQHEGMHGAYHDHFNGLHEAIVSQQEKNSLPKILELPELSAERTWLMSDEARELREEVAQRKHIPVDDIYWVGKRGKDDWESVSYGPHRKTLEFICDEISKEFPGVYPMPDAVFKEFLKAHFTGKLLTIARLVEKTFGEGSFRILGNMTDDKESGILHLETFEKARARVLKQKERER